MSGPVRNCTFIDALSGSEIHLWVARAQKEIDASLAPETASVSVPERNNYRFQLAMVATAKLVRQPVRFPKQLSRLAHLGHAVPLTIPDRRPAWRAQYGSRH